MQGYQGEGRAFWIQFKYISRNKAQLPSDCCNCQVFQVFPPNFLLSPWERDGCTATIPRGHSHLLKCPLCTGLISALLCTNIKERPPSPLKPQSIHTNTYWQTGRHSGDRLGKRGTYLSYVFWLYINYSWSLPARDQVDSSLVHSSQKPKVNIKLPIKCLPF